MIGRRRFDQICGHLRSQFSPQRLEFCLQTNATLIDAAWIDLLSKYDVQVCTSIDGAQEAHDKYRVDKRGRGTYSSTVRGIALLIGAREQGRLGSVACLAVIQPEFSGKAAYEHIRELGFAHMDFLFPDVTYQDFSGNPRDYGRFLIQVFDAWIRENDATVQVRVLKSVMSVLLGGRSYLAGFGSDLPSAFTVRSDGSVELDDFLRMCGMDAVFTGIDIAALDSLKLFQSEKLSQLQADFSKRPQACLNCLYEPSCRGGQITHRFSRENGFANSSLFCDGLFDIFTHISKFLVREGVSLDKIPGIACHKDALASSQSG
jgi:uncharacterized protein